MVRVGDRVFASLATGSGAFVVAVIAAIGIFLLLRAIPALRTDQVSFLFSGAWNTSDPSHLSFGILDLAWITVSSSVVALVIAMPLSCGIALFLTQYAPRSLARPFAYIVDLLAADQASTALFCSCGPASARRAPASVSLYCLKLSINS